MDCFTQNENIAEQLKLSNGKLWFTIGILNENEELYDEAIRCYVTALNHNPSNLEALSHLAHIYKLKKQYINAVFSYDKYLKINAEDGIAWMNLGECFLALQELNKAHSCLKNANKFIKQEPKLWFQLGCLYEKAGLFEQAEAYYKRVLERSYPENAAELHFKMAMIYKQHAQYEECFEILTSECWNNPPEGMSQQDILCQLVQLFQLTDSIEIGKDAHEKAISLINENEPPFVYILLGWLTHLIVMNPSVNEVFHFEEEFPYQIVFGVIQKDPTNVLGLYVYGRILADSKHQQNAFDAFHQALQLDHNNPLYWCSIGNLYYHTEQYSEAIKAYFKAISLTPQLPEVWFNMGSLYIFHNQRDDAASSFKRAHELDPKNPTYRAMLDVEKVSERPQIIDPSPFATLPNYTIDTFTKPSLPTNIPLNVLTELQKIRIPDLTQI
ncbi:hypothetical protein, conserved [Entamoeba dispar SAW760]|uniref:Uncharacterized protein n=1 Tax=Entamoeba dispar (strain ATCC PRA-260 / SAW760) TaxID=370354 RepID=B0EG77_ENTDS|nr:uncharacterized protein EDI_009670 [Entamoeba dispar SAW760]EDR26454.1 hypothetical protein, conserved [Entamoeba dispar SAW760]|eukprot:EDR26454.1 hypothetical protein, conserved [Entamoeba dispar SAW760]